MFTLTPELKLLLELAQISERTLRNWRSGRVRPPAAARVLERIIVHGELPHAGPAWEGWRFYAQRLISPEGYQFEPLDITRAHYWRAAAEAARESRTRAQQFFLPGF